MTVGTQMTVKELKQLLEQFPENLPVAIETDWRGSATTVRREQTYFASGLRDEVVISDD